jgi:pyruvate ferredoxin oxidoreductase gamma subunit
VGRPLPNAALLGGFAALTGAVALESVCAAVRERFPGAVGERNVAAVTAAYHQIAERTPRAAAAEAPC